MRSIVTCVVALGALAQRSPAQDTEIIGVRPNGAPGNLGAFGGSVSDDGRFVAFLSYSTNIVTGDTNNRADCFVRDRLLATTRRASVSSSGAEANDDSLVALISGDGNVVAFESEAKNLWPADMNNRPDVFVHDLRTGITECVSINLGGATARESSALFGISADGTRVCFRSGSDDLVPGDTNGAVDFFVRDRVAGVTTRVTIRSDGTQANGNSHGGGISSDGRYVAFQSDATNLDAADADANTDIYRHDLSNGTTALVGLGWTGAKPDVRAVYVGISDDGRRVAFASAASSIVPNDDATSTDLFERDVESGDVRCLSVDRDGKPSHGEGTGESSLRFVTFRSLEEDLVDGDLNAELDVFLREVSVGVTTRGSIDAAGGELDDYSFGGDVTPDGTVFVFQSNARYVIPGLFHATPQVYARTRSLQRAGTNEYGSGVAGKLGVPSIGTDRPPTMGYDTTLEFGNSLGLWTVAIVLLGEEAAQIPTGFGVDLLVTPLVSVLVAVPTTGGAVSGSIPVHELMPGETWYAQALLVDPYAIDGIASTPGLELVLGW